MGTEQFQQSIFDNASAVGGHEGHAVRSCLRHLQRAKQLIEEMPELAVFSAITAQEEAATALLLTLRKRKYTGSEKLNIRNHVHKTGVLPMVELITSAFLPAATDFSVTLGFAEEGKRKVLKYKIPFRINNEQFYMEPVPPLQIFSKEKGGLPPDYHAKISKIATEAGIDSIFEHIKKLANERNRMLYASSSGIPEEVNPRSRVQYFDEAAMRTLILYLLIEPYHEKQNLVQEALSAYIKVLERVPPNLE
ncbi:hypothetical protein [Marinobacterium lutimaris]|uniref:AbiV family abortive infection protein n=1 Tax=Marinobacterium lutimaris TaxID=568106 RepID=A0A1H5XLS9_9GAMM|nr:hypothetical protein [Marinobacterium lutimaris]SEG12698.1 hypothetical protein SAMN05444390_1011431 [Marinobacterium lutimaris]